MFSAANVSVSALVIIEVSLSYCFDGVIIDSYEGNLVALTSESHSFCQEPGRHRHIYLYQWTHALKHIILISCEYNMFFFFHNSFCAFPYTTMWVA